MAKTCPQCQYQMQTKNIHGVDLDLCPNCGGVWFDSDELRSLIARDPKSLTEVERMAVPEAAQTTAGPSAFQCPNDSQQLRQYHYLYNSPVILETCDVCGGFFIQDGELEKMQQFLDANRQPMSKKDQIASDLALEISQHDREMQRAENLTTMFNMFRRYQPGWYGLF